MKEEAMAVHKAVCDLTKEIHLARLAGMHTE